MRFDSAVAELTAAAPEQRSYRWVAAPLLAFALFSLTAGLLANHEPRSKGYFRLFFSDPLHLKAGFATAAAVLVLPAVHRGLDLQEAALAETGLGFRLHRFPRPVLPLAGGALFAVLIVVLYTSALWLYSQDTAAAAPAKSSPIPADADATVGAKVFRTAACGSCHTLKAANAGGQIGPDLDAVRPSFATVRAKVAQAAAECPPSRGS